MTIHEKFMRRCLSLAKGGEGSVSPNPLVGCVIVNDNRIIGEGFHREFGGPHAEVLAIEAVKNKESLSCSTLYVTLEPCAHYGKTPPCTELIIRNRIPRVFIGMIDPFPAVAGKGMETLRKAGIVVETGIMEEECREMNRRFLTFHMKKRPYVILKWAQTLDGFMDADRSTGGTGLPVKISGSLSHLLVHRQRTMEDAVLVGTHTALNDDPELTARDWSGKNPVRIVIDRTLRLPSSLKLFDGKGRTIVFNEVKSDQSGNICREKIDFSREITGQMLCKLYEWNIQSLIVEGGAYTLREFIRHNHWDEAHMYTGNVWFFRGLKAPGLSGEITATEKLEESTLTIVHNRNFPL
jgi:diaminohydroxyphosphoribosylaminopyrimidine deaminase / 5-amino-6-(5-phosphoribosylamino)uracil reductase